MTIQENVPLAPLTTLGVGGPARWFVETSDEEEVLAAVRFARARAVPYFVLGGGSNLLVSDDGFPGVVVHITGGHVDFHCRDVASIRADAGIEWDSIVRLAVDNNCDGIECLAGIPGSVGGTPVQNVGAYGQEVSNTIERVRAVDLLADTVVELTSDQCGFAYRRSIFNTTHKGRYAITRVIYGLTLGGVPNLAYRDVKQYFAERRITQPSLARTADAVREIRARKGMLIAESDPDSRSAGSFFKNPIVPAALVPRVAALGGCRAEDVPQFPAGSEYAPADAPNAVTKLSAAWLIERSDFHKGFAIGRAGLSTKHVLAIVNRGHATAAEILALRDTVTTEVHGRFGIALEQEPVMLGFPQPR